ncbi:MAG: carboxypeptidase regulatory-like domain-containing protein [Phycisphaerae bacterium]|nr:carboxypeptidase regulatory-like domain-containing protein [Phycisphaerae bacterium]
MSDLKEAIRIRVGRTLSVERLDVTQKTSCWEFVTLFLFVAACTTVSVSLFPFIAYHRLPNRFHELFPAIIGMPMLLLSTMMVRRLGWLTDQVHCRRSRVEKDSMSEAKMCQQGPLALTHEEMVDCFKATGFHAILMIAMMGLIIFVAPQFYALFSDSAIALPKMTAVTIGLFDVIQRFGLILIPVLLAIDFGIGFSLRHCLRRPAFRVYSFVCSILLVLIPLIMFGILALSTQDVLMASRQLKQTQQGDPFMAHLSQGSIELVGVSSDSGEGNIWWKPDGSLSEVSFVTSKSGLSMSSDTQIRQFVLSFRDFTEDQLARMAWKYDLVSSGGGTGPITYTGDKEFGLLKMRSASLPVSAKTVTISVGLGLDAWETVAQYRGDVGNEIELTHQGNRWMLHFFPPAKSDGNIQVTVVHNIKDWQYRFVAVDTREVIHEAHMTGDTTSQTNAQAVFKDIQMSDIQNFQFQVRPYHWATFTGVALQPRSDVLRNAGEALFQSHQKKALVDFNDPSFWRTQIKRHLEGVRTLDCELITDRLVYEADANTPESRVRQQYSLKWDRDHRWIDCAVTDVERNLLKNRIIQGDQFGWSLRANTWTKVKAGSGGFLMSQFSNFGEMRSQPYQHAFSVAKGILCSDTIQRTQVQGVIDWNQIEMVHSVDDQKRHVLKHSMPMPGPEGQMLTADMVLIGTWEQGAFKLLELRGQCLALDMDLLAEAYSEHVFVDGLWVPQRAEMSEWTDPQAGAPPRLQEKTTVTVQRISVNQPMTAAIFDGFEPPVGVRVDNQLTGKNYRVWPDLDQIKASGGKVWVSVKGRVYLDGKPSVGAIVTTAVFDDPNEAIGHTVSATSDEKGEFELKSLMPGLEYMVQAQDQAGHTVSQPAQLSELGEDYTGLKLDMTSGLTATGTVTDPNGLPLAQARVQFSGKSMVETDDQGRYAVNGLYADQRYEVKAVARGFAPLDPGSESSVANYEIVLGDEGEPEPFNIVLQKEWILSGRVVDQDSQPVSGVRVMVWSSPFGTGDLWQWYDTRTDQEGKFSVGNLGDRIYTFFVGQYGNVCHSPLESPILFRVTGDSFMPNPLPGRGLVPPEIVTGVETFELPYRQFFRLREYSEASRQNKGGKLLSQWIEQLYTADHAGRCEVLARLGSVPAYHALDTFELILSGRKIQDARGSGTFTTFGSNMASATEPGPCPEDLVNCQDKGIVCLAMRAVARTGFVGEHAGLLIDKLDDPNALVRDTALVALAELTGVYVGDEKTQWQDWLKQYQDARSSLDTRGNFPLIESLCQLCRQDEWSKQGIECMMAAWQGASEGASRFRKQLEGDEGKAIWAFFASVDLNGDDPIRRGHPFGYWPSDIFRSQGHQNYDLKFRVARSCTLGSQVFEPNVWYCLPALFRDGFQGQWEIVDLRLDDIERDASSK